MTGYANDTVFDQNIGELALTLHEHGDKILVGVTHKPLPTASVSMLDRYRLEYVFLPIEDRRQIARTASWQVFLNRYQPDVVHFGPSIPSQVAERFAARSRPEIVIIEDLYSFPRLARSKLAYWHPMLYLSRLGKPSWIRDQVTHSPLGVVVLGERLTQKMIAEFIASIHPVIRIYHNLQFILLVEKKVIKQYAKGLPPDILRCLKFVQSEYEWQREALFAICAIGAGIRNISLRLLGAAMALNCTSIVMDSHVGDSQIAHAPTVKCIPEGDTPALLDELRMLSQNHVADEEGTCA